MDKAEAKALVAAHDAYTAAVAAIPGSTTLGAAATQVQGAYTEYQNRVQGLTGVECVAMGEAARRRTDPLAARRSARPAIPGGLLFCSRIRASELRIARTSRAMPVAISSSGRSFRSRPKGSSTSPASSSSPMVEKKMNISAITVP